MFCNLNYYYMLKMLVPYLLLLTEDDIMYGVFKSVDASALSYSIECMVDELIVAAPIRVYFIDAI